MDEQKPPPISIVDWIASKKADDLPESVGWMGGWFNAPNQEKGMRWKDYVETYAEHCTPYLEALRAAVLKDKLVIVGDEHQNDKRPLFSDNTTALFSMRAWGDLMAAIYSELEDKDYTYMDFYMHATCPKLNGSMARDV